MLADVFIIPVRVKLFTFIPPPHLNMFNHQLFGVKCDFKSLWIAVMIICLLVA